MPPPFSLQVVILPVRPTAAAASGCNGGGDGPGDSCPANTTDAAAAVRDACQSLLGSLRAAGLLAVFDDEQRAGGLKNGGRGRGGVAITHACMHALIHAHTRTFTCAPSDHSTARTHTITCIQAVKHFTSTYAHTHLPPPPHTHTHTQTHTRTHIHN